MLERVDPTPAPGTHPVPPQLAELLRSLVARPGIGARLLERQRINGRVERLRFEVGGERRSVVVKRLRPEVARRNRLVASRWLPAVGLGRFGPIVLGAASAPGGEWVWQVYEDHGPTTLEIADPDERRVEQAVAVVAAIHTRFAQHGLLGECRLWGGDLGIAFVAGSLHDAAAALRALTSPAVTLPSEVGRVRARLLRRLEGLLDELPRRAAELEDLGLPETFLHGDLWRQNIVLIPGDAVTGVRLIDWDHAGVGPVAYDLSTLLQRFGPDERLWILERYRRAVAGAGWELPDASRLNRVLDTAEQARIANRLIWPAIAILTGDGDWGPAALIEIEGWFETLRPILPSGRWA